MYRKTIYFEYFNLVYDLWEIQITKLMNNSSLSYTTFQQIRQTKQYTKTKIVLSYITITISRIWGKHAKSFVKT